MYSKPRFIHVSVGNKIEIVNKLKQDDLKICTLFNKIIGMNQFHTLLSQCGPGQISVQQQQEILVSLNYRNQEIRVPRSVIREFHKQAAISSRALDAIMIMFQIRCDRIRNGYESVHRDEVGYRPLPGTAFVPLSFYRTLCEDPARLEANTANRVDFRQSYIKWVIPFLFPNSPSEFGMTYVDVRSRHVGIFDPFDGVRPDGSLIPPQEIEEEGRRIGFGFRSCFVQYSAYLCTIGEVCI